MCAFHASSIEPAVVQAHVARSPSAPVMLARVAVVLLASALAACSGDAGAIGTSQAPPSVPSTSTMPATSSVNPSNVASMTPSSAPSSAPPSAAPSAPSAAPAAILGTIEVGSGPCALETSPDGRVFATLYNTGDVVEIDPATSSVTSLAGLKTRICGLAWAGDALWVADLSASAVAEVDPSSGKVLQTTAVSGQPWDVQPDATGVWVADRGLPGAVHIDAATGKVDRSVQTGALPTGLAVVDGHAWVSVQGANEVDRLNAAGKRIDLRVTDGLGALPTWFADGDGALWVTDNSGNVTRINPRSGAVTASLLLGGAPRDPVFAFGALWVANGSDGVLYRIDPATNAIAGTVQLATGIWTVEQIRQEVWVEQYNGSRIFRVDPNLVR